MLERIDQLCDLLGRTVAWFIAVMAVTTVAIVLLRYLFDQGTIVLQEGVMYLHGIAFMLAIPYALKDGAHVRVDLLYSKMSSQRRGLVDFCGHWLFLLPVAGFVFVSSLSYVQASWRVLEGSSEVGGIPAVFILKTLIPVTAALLFLQGIAEIVRAYKTMKAD